MLFSSVSFLYYFLPILIVIYFIVKPKYRNLVLLVFSLLFYFIGEPKYIIVLLLSCFINYFISHKMYKSKYPKRYLLLAVIYNVGSLLFFKYTDFFISNINNIFNTKIPFMYIIMPIGISFFTFQALSYIIDVYNKKYEPCPSLLNFMTYITLFPQLVAGPIVRYKDVYKSLENRETNYDKFSYGIKRFSIGLGKKVLIANVVGEIIKSLVDVTVVSSWLKPILFTIQIYFDFSGYSDMAIGLGSMFGFKFLENFNYPLISKSITDFWRRWHISLSSWFRDYVYIPLGGNRVSKLKWVRNIFIVWFLTGFWHGASWNFIIWGLYFGVLLLIEKIFLKKYLDKTHVFKYLYTFLIVVISFLIFSSDNIQMILDGLKNMFLINKIPVTSYLTNYYLKSNIIFLIICIIGATPLPKLIIDKLNNTKFKKVINVLEPIFYIGIIILSTAFLIDESFNPFLYFRF